MFSDALHNASDLKTRKEQFVSNLTGSSQVEVCLTILCLPLCVVTVSVIQTLLSHRWGSHGRRLALASEFLLFVLPMVGLTMSAPWLLPATLLGVLAAVAAYRLSFAGNPVNHFRQLLVKLQPAENQQQQQQETSIRASSGIPDSVQGRRLALEGLLNLGSHHKGYVTTFRGGLMVMTCVCILAVDFMAFPRRFAKTELFGTSLMDVGVGMFIFAGGLVSHGRRHAAGGDSKPVKSLAARLSGAARSTAVCWVLGLSRLVAMRALNYQEHVGEYGVHWNFFCTIGVVGLLAAAVDVSPCYSLVAAAAVTALHQLLLTAGGLGPWCLSPVRGSDLLSLNKEGVASCPGYWALHLWGAAVAHLMEAGARAALKEVQDREQAGNEGASLAGLAGPGGSRTTQPSPVQPVGPPSPPLSGVADGCLASRRVVRSNHGCKRRQDSWQDTLSPEEEEEGRLTVDPVSPAVSRRLLLWLLAAASADGGLWALFFAVEAHTGPVSRRCCNAAYILWVVALASASLVLLAASQAALPHAPPLRLLRAMGGGRGMLPTFLVANLLTGAVNMVVDTLEVGDALARCIVGAYMLAVCSAALLLEPWCIKRSSSSSKGCDSNTERSKRA